MTREKIIREKTLNGEQLADLRALHRRQGHLGIARENIILTVLNAAVDAEEVLWNDVAIALGYESRDDAAVAGVCLRYDSELGVVTAYQIVNSQVEHNEALAEAWGKVIGNADIYHSLPKHTRRRLVSRRISDAIKAALDGTFPPGKGAEAKD